MSLEEDIKQPKFKNEHLKAGINIIYTASYLSNIQAHNFKKHNLTSPQYNILRILRGQHPSPATINLLMERMLDKSSNVSRIVEKLKSKGLIDRIQCPEDRRAVNVKITEKGLLLLSKIDLEEDQFFNSIQNLSYEETVSLNNLLDKIRR